MFWTKLREQAAVSTGNFARLFGNMEIPALHQTAVRLLEMVRDEDVNVSEAARVIAADTGLTTKILRTVNAAAYGLPRKVTDIRHAVVLLGIQRIQLLVLAYSAMKVLSKKVPGFEPRTFWQDSLQRAVFAQALASDICQEAQGEAYTGALLQDMALPILLSQWGAHYQPLMLEAQRSGKSLIEIEEAELSWNHAQAGAWMARNWGFADVLVCCIGLHHASAEELASLNLKGTPVSVVAISSLLPDHEVIIRDILGWEEEAYWRMCATADETCADLAELFGIPAPQPLVQHATA